MGKPISEELFLQRAQARFGERFDYSLIHYKSYKTPVRIRCKVHPVKEITITPEKHLETMGGCRFCLRERRIQGLEREFLAPCATDLPLVLEQLPLPGLQRPG